MTITLFVEPESFSHFVEVTDVLKKLPIENDYVFYPEGLKFTNKMISNYIWINIEVEEYLKLKYAMCKLSKYKINI